MRSSPAYCIIFFIALCLVSFIISCKSNPPVITLTTANITGITQISAVSGGNIITKNWGPVISKGVCWATTTDPTLEDNKTNDGAGTEGYLSTMKGLQPGTDYYVRAFAITKTDTVYGGNVFFSTRGYETVTDVEGNVYKNVSIGTQRWMAENLRTTKLSDGTPIPLVKGEAAWAGLNTSGFCWYRNEEEAFKPTYGALYNWYAINTGKLCPQGWHVPGDEEWTQLTTYLGGDLIAGGKLKETGLTYWVEPNNAATNESGFTAYPGGFRYYDGKFFDFGFSSYWWSSKDYSATRAWFRLIYYSDGNIYRFNNNKKNGFSVRCLKD